MEAFAFTGTAAQQSPFVPTERESAPARIPTNAFRVGWEGKIEEGFVLDFDHPTFPMRTALIFGESGHYLSVNTWEKRACVLEDFGTRQLAKRVLLDEIKPRNGGKSFLVMSKLERPAPYVLVHVDFGTPLTVKPKMPLWAGISGDYHKVGWGGNEAVAMLDKERSDLRVFYADGRVGVMSYNMCGTSADLVFIDQPEDVLVVRLSNVEQMLTEADNINDVDRKQRFIDRWFHELATMLDIIGTSPQMRQQIMNAVERLTETYSPSNGVRTRLKNILLSFGDRTIYGWLFAKPSDDTTPSFLDQVSKPVHKGPPAERLKQLATRRDNDIKDRSAKKTSGGGGSQKQGKSKQK
jgi:hypothetical protein